MPVCFCWHKLQYMLKSSIWKLWTDWYLSWTYQPWAYRIPSVTACSWIEPRMHRAVPEGPSLQPTTETWLQQQEHIQEPYSLCARTDSFKFLYECFYSGWRQCRHLIQHIIVIFYLCAVFIGKEPGYLLFVLQQSLFGQNGGCRLDSEVIRSLLDHSIECLREAHILRFTDFVTVMRFELIQSVDTI